MKGWEGWELQLRLGFVSAKLCHIINFILCEQDSSTLLFCFGTIRAFFNFFSSRETSVF